MQVRRLINRSFLRGSHISLFLTLIGCSTLHRTLYNDRRNLHGNQRRRFIFMVEQLSRHLHLAHRPLLLPTLSPPCHCRSSPIWGATFSRWHSAYGSVDPWAYSQRELVTGWRLRAVVNLRRFRCSKCVRVETIHIFRLTRDIQPQKKILQFTDFVREKEFIIAALPDCDHLGPFIKRTVLGITRPPHFTAPLYVPWPRSSPCASRVPSGRNPARPHIRARHYASFAPPTPRYHPPPYRTGAILQRPPPRHPHRSDALLTPLTTQGRALPRARRAYAYAKASVAVEVVVMVRKRASETARASQRATSRILPSAAGALACRAGVGRRVEEGQERDRGCAGGGAACLHSQERATATALGRQ